MIKHISVAVYFLLLLLLMTYRITIGVDLSDESYYASFLDGWLKLGMGHSPNLMLHQTASWLIFPFAAFYHWFFGDMGLILFLRILYVTLSFATMLCFFCFAKHIAPVYLAALVSGMVFLFIPWSLPTLSYNTLGMLSMFMALCLFGMLILNLEKRVHRLTFLSSCFLWAVAIISYPPLMLVLLFFLFTAYFFLSNQKARHLIKNYTLYSVFILGFLSILLLFTLGIHHVKAMLSFTDAVNHVSDGFSRKWAMVWNFFSQNTLFFILSLAGLILGLGKTFFDTQKFVPPIIPQLVYGLSYLFLGSVFYFCLFSNNVLFLHSHDFIFILALAGLYIPLQTIFYQTYPPIIALLYCTSLFAGLVTTAIAYNNLYNFHLGGFLAACLSLLFMLSKLPLPRVRYFFLTFIFMVGANCVMLASDYHYIYGERLNPLQYPSVRIQQGIFAGLRTSISKANIIYQIQQFLPQHIFDKSLVVFGLNSGAYLLTSLSAQALVTWNWETVEGDTVDKAITNFYQIKNNQPDFIFRFKDQWSLPLNQTEQFLMANYHLIKEIKTSEILLQLYAQK
jgi:hypothetical protein